MLLRDVRRPSLSADRLLDRLAARAPCSGAPCCRAGAAGAGAAGKVMDKLGVGDENESGWEDPPRLGCEPSLITPMEADDNEDVSTGKVGKKDKGSYQHAYKLALRSIRFIVLMS